MQAPAGLKVSYSGIRGVVGESLTWEVAYGFGRAFVELLRRNIPLPHILIARDTRASGDELLKALSFGLSAFPCRLTTLQIVATPSLQQAITDLSADGAIMISASHNPAEWNGFKFFKAPENTILNPQEMKTLFSLYQEVSGKAVYGYGMRIKEIPDKQEEVLQMHLEKVLSYVDRDLIASRKIAVELDSAGGAGEQLGIKLLQALGCEMEVLRSSRPSEPIPENLAQLGETVQKRGAAIGFAQDLDADRLAIVDETGAPIGEDYTLALVTRHLLEKYRDSHPVVVRNAATSHAIDELARQFNAQLVETRVGEVNLSMALMDLLNQRRLAFGGEGNGGVIFPPISLGRDSFTGMAFVLEYLAKRNLPLSQLVAELPRFYQQKAKIQLTPGESPEIYMEKLKILFLEAEPNYLDGLKLIFADKSWLSLRSSNTEPIMRLTSESPDEKRAQELLQTALATLS